jgi:hypothetical protein
MNRMCLEDDSLLERNEKVKNFLNLKEAKYEVGRILWGKAIKLIVIDYNKVLLDY